MPTPAGLPRANEIWERRFQAHGAARDPRREVIRFRVVERGRGDYWSLRVDLILHTLGGEAVPIEQHVQRRQLWVDASHWFALGELRYIEEAR